MLLKEWNFHFSWDSLAGGAKEKIMAMMTVRAATRGPPNLSSFSSYNHHQYNPTRNKLTIMGSSFLNSPCFLISSNITKLQKFVPVQASNSQGGGEGEETSSLNGTTSGIPQVHSSLSLYFFLDFKQVLAFIEFLIILDLESSSIQ